MTLNDSSMRITEKKNMEVKMRCLGLPWWRSG